MGSMFVRSNMDAFQEGLREIARRQVPFVVSKAVNDTAADAKKWAGLRVKRRFHKPVPFVRRSPSRTLATKRRPVARVLILPKQAAFLRYQERGGTRAPSRKAITIPQGVDLNAYDNMTKRKIKTLLRRKDVFTAGKNEGVKPGIYRNMPNGGVKLLVSFVEKASYKPIFGFEEGVEKVARNRMPTHLNRNFRRILANPKLKTRRGRRVLA